jgi:hypothetical protein
MSRRPLDQLSPSTINNYKCLLRRLWLKSTAGAALTSDLLEISELENLLGLKGSETRGPGRPRKYQ